MSSFDIDVSEINSLAHELDAHGKDAKREASKVVRRTAFAVVATAQQFVPVDTGATKSSIHASAPSGGSLAAFSLEAEIGPTTEYAPHLEYGTSKMAPHAFMGPALDRHGADFVDALAEIPDLL